MAREPLGTSVLGQNLPARARIPANYLSKILWTLRNAGYLEATRGHGGGYRLARPADEITLVEVVRLFEGANAEPGCLLGKHLLGKHLLGEQRDCCDQDACSAHASWKHVKTPLGDTIERHYWTLLRHSNSKGAGGGHGANAGLFGAPGR